MNQVLNQPLVIVGCGALKRTQPSRADELYTGPLHRAALAYARTRAGDDDIRIMSARYGLLKLDTIIALYELRLTPQIVPIVVELLVGHFLAEEYGAGRNRPGTQFHEGARPVVMLAPALYHHTFCSAWHRRFRREPQVECPLRGLGLGQQIKWLKENTR